MTTSARDIRVLLVDADGETRRTLTRRLTEHRVLLRAVNDLRAALREAAARAFDVVIVDVVVDDADEFGFVDALCETDPDVAIIVRTRDETRRPGLVACRHGAFATLDRAADFERLWCLLLRAAEHARLRRENAALREFVDAAPPGAAPVDTLRVEIERCAETRVPLLVVSERGSDREATARSVHVASERGGTRFVAVDLTTFGADGMQVALFGHLRGAFTGADVDRRGALAAAAGGTVFLDHIDRLDAASQAELVRLVEQGELRPVGASAPRAIDLRLIAGTAADLEEEVAAHRFRRDLFTRLSVLRITVPPLRQRPHDVVRLARAILDRRGRTIDDEAATLLEGYDWPGNERELSAVLERAVLLSQKDPVETALLAGLLSVTATSPGATLDALQRRHIVEMLRQTGGNKSETAKRLAIGRRKLYRLIEKFDLDAETAAS